MKISEELLLSKPPQAGHEMVLALLLTREHVVRLLDEGLFQPEGITDQQYNVLRILRGGPAEGHLIKDIRQRMISRSADVPRLVDRLVAQGLVARQTCPEDRRACRVQLTAKGRELEARMHPRHDALMERVDRALSPEERAQLLHMLERLRDDYRAQVAELAGQRPTPPARRR